MARHNSTAQRRRVTALHLQFWSEVAVSNDLRFDSAPALYMHSAQGACTFCALSIVRALNALRSCRTFCVLSSSPASYALRHPVTFCVPSSGSLILVRWCWRRVRRDEAVWWAAVFVCHVCVSSLAQPEPRKSFHSTRHCAHCLYVSVAKNFAVIDHRKREVAWIAQTGRALRMCLASTVFNRTHPAIFRSFSDSAAADPGFVPSAVKKNTHGSLWIARLFIF